MPSAGGAQSKVFGPQVAHLQNLVVHVPTLNFTRRKMRFARLYASNVIHPLVSSFRQVGRLISPDIIVITIDPEP